MKHIWVVILVLWLMYYRWIWKEKLNEVKRNATKESCNRTNSLIRVLNMITLNWTLRTKRTRATRTRTPINYCSSGVSLFYTTRILNHKGTILWPHSSRNFQSDWLNVLIHEDFIVKLFITAVKKNLIYDVQ